MPSTRISFSPGEPYLNLIGAKYNTGDEDGAKDALNIIRDRAIPPHVRSSGTGIWNDMVYERRIELSLKAPLFWKMQIGDSW
ncbi:MAG: RagB/SusD family nutrient uptake outer membrane protein [Ginsengibacter sp.]